ncbi:DUF1760-domain-containing protein [Thozetella sp. PMI_491]|nr:DUF1760-domain-containing protein [Thozetella sp. PMI_491]
MSSDEVAKAITAITDSRPPATDRFTYLTILESHLSPEILPALNDILQDTALTQDIGWDLVFHLVGIPGSEACLRTIARLGNPREVILKALEALEVLGQDEGYQSNDEASSPEILSDASVTATGKFIALLGMLDILHKRIQTKYPSRFLLQTLQTICRCYQPNQEMTAAVINLVHSLSGRRRPTLPTRKSSIEVSNLALSCDASGSAPDPEAENDDVEDPTESEMQHRLLLCFVTCILEAYINRTDMGWAGRLLEFYQPDKLVPGKPTLTAGFREDQELLARDATVGKLVALTRDLGLTRCSPEFLDQVSEAKKHGNPLSEAERVSNPRDIALSTGGSVCLLAYWVFSSTIFDADQPQPPIYLFPTHLTMISRFLGDDPESWVLGTPGTAQAIVTIGLWLEFNDRISATPAVLPSKPTASAEDPGFDFMAYVHSATLVALYHPLQHVRNASSVLAGAVLHADPLDDDRLRILYDLLENCEFAQLKAIAVSWLREELLRLPTPCSSEASPSIFATPQALEAIQYAVFPSMTPLVELDTNRRLEHIVQNLPFFLQVVNFALLLWSSDKWGHVLPANMASAAAERWFHPLQSMVGTLIRATDAGGEFAGGDLSYFKFDLEVLQERLERLGETEAFKAWDTADRA